VGISCYPSLAFEEEQLFNQANAALYNAKKSHNEQIQIWQNVSESLAGAQQLNIPYVAVPAEMVTTEIARFIPLQVARQYCCVPVGYERGHLTVAMLDPTDSNLLKTLATVTRLAIHPVISNLAEIKAALIRLCELSGKVGVANVVISKLNDSQREVKLTVNPISPGSDLGPAMRELASICSNLRVQVRNVESYVMILATSAAGCSNFIKELQRINDLLIESVVGDNS
jgi:hypothetical protein